MGKELTYKYVKYPSCKKEGFRIARSGKKQTKELACENPKCDIVLTINADENVTVLRVKKANHPKQCIKYNKDLLYDNYPYLGEMAQDIPCLHEDIQVKINENTISFTFTSAISLNNLAEELPYISTYQATPQSLPPQYTGGATEFATPIHRRRQCLS